jgi:TonB family protein
MKKNFYFFALLVCSFVLWQGCASKSQEENNESAAKADSVEIKKAEAIVARKARLAEESAARAEQRALALAEKTKLSSTYKDASGKLIYLKAEVDPSYTGGQDEMRKYLRDNLKYPQEARDNGVEGTVFVDFVIDEKGRVREVVASDAVGENADLLFKEEAVRVVAAMPGWKAGTQRGKAVDVSFSIPISFELSN